MRCAQLNRRPNCVAKASEPAGRGEETPDDLGARPPPDDATMIAPATTAAISPTDTSPARTGARACNLVRAALTRPCSTTIVIRTSSGPDPSSGLLFFAITFPVCADLGSPSRHRWLSCAHQRTVTWVVRWLAMARTPLDETAELKAADVIHKRFSTLPTDATVAQVRDWFAESSHRRMAFLADNGRYVGSMTRDDLDGDLDPNDAAVQAGQHRTHDCARRPSARRLRARHRDARPTRTCGRQRRHADRSYRRHRRPCCVLRHHLATATRREVLGEHNQP